MPLATRSLSPRRPGHGRGARPGDPVRSVDHLGGAVCLRDPSTAAERLGAVKVDEVLKLIEERYEQRWVPRVPGVD